MKTLAAIAAAVIVTATLTSLAQNGGTKPAVTVAADKGACKPDYRQGAWHICSVTVPAPSEDFYTVRYQGDHWILYVDETKH